MTEKSLKQKVTPMEFLRKYAVVLTLIVLVIVATIATGGLFVSPNNLQNIGERAAVTGIVALGQMLVILTGGIELSVGGIIAIGFSLTSTFLNNWDLPVPLVILMTLAVTSLCGLINGILVAKTKVPPFMLTMGTYLFFQSLAFFITGAQQLEFGKMVDFITNSIGLDPSFSWALPTSLWIVFSVLIILLLAYTRFGRNLYATGGKELAAKLSGIKTNNVKLTVYTVSGFFCGVAALALAYRLRSANPEAGEAYQLESVAAVVVGGTNINGGEGNVYGTFVGAIIMASLVNLLNVLGTDPYIQDAIKGVILIFFVFIMQYLAKSK